MKIKIKNILIYVKYKHRNYEVKFTNIEKYKVFGTFDSVYIGNLISNTKEFNVNNICIIANNVNEVHSKIEKEILKYLKG